MLDQRTLVETPQGLVVVGEDVRPHSARHGAWVARAEIWDGKHWSRYPESDVQGCCWHWTGERVISTYRVTRHQSRKDTYRAGALDPATGTWSALPWLPAGHPPTLDSGWPVADGPLAFSNDFLYDDTDRSSTLVETPNPGLANSGLVLGDHTLMVFGGYEVAKNSGRIMSVRPTNQAWAIELPDAG